MLEKIRALIDTYKDEEHFSRRILLNFPFGSVGYSRITHAYAETMRDFNNVVRDSGTAYFGHPEAVAIILLEYLRFRDVDAVIAAILHDNLEDLRHLGWSQKRVIQSYGQEVSELVWWVTKPDLEEFGGCKEERDRVYHARLSSAPRIAVMIKLADRLHNIMTLWSQDEVKQQRKIQETRNFYLPLAEKHTLLIHEIEAAIAEVEGSWKVRSL